MRLIVDGNIGIKTSATDDVKWQGANRCGIGARETNASSGMSCGCSSIGLLHSKTFSRSPFLLIFLGNG